MPQNVKGRPIFATHHARRCCLTCQKGLSSLFGRRSGTLGRGPCTKSEEALGSAHGHQGAQQALMAGWGPPGMRLVPARHEASELLPKIYAVHHAVEKEFPAPPERGGTVSKSRTRSGRRTALSYKKSPTAEAGPKTHSRLPCLLEEHSFGAKPGNAWVVLPALSRINEAT